MIQHFQFFNRPVLTFFLFFLTGLLASCGDKQPVKSVPPDTRAAGTIHISVDEAFQPVIAEQIAVFEAAYPGAKVIAHYKTEQACFNDLLHDTLTRMIIVSRGLSEDEQGFFMDSLKQKLVSVKVANDAVAVIVNNSSPDSVFTMNEIRAMLDGSGGVKKKLVFDGLTASGTVRYAMDSVLKGKPLSRDIRAANSSQEVIDYVSKNQDAIGFLGISWIGNREDSSQRSFLKSVRIAWLDCAGCKSDSFVKPLQLNIATKQYPMVRGLHYILNERHDGLGSSFGNFLFYERGQLIFKRAYLVPTNISFYIRDTRF